MPPLPQLPLYSCQLVTNKLRYKQADSYYCPKISNKLVAIMNIHTHSHCSRRGGAQTQKRSRRRSRRRLHLFVCVYLAQVRKC